MAHRDGEAYPDNVEDGLGVVAAGVQYESGERRQWEAMQGFDAYDRMGELRVPTLIWHGTEDRLVAPPNTEVPATAISALISRHP